MVVATLPSGWIDRVGPVEGVELVTWDLDGTPARADEVVLCCMPYQLDPAAYGHFDAVPNLRTVQLLTAGYEHAVPSLPDGVELANARGVHGSATAEMALTLTLAMQRQVPEMVRNAQAGLWTRPEFLTGLAGKAVLVVGYGDIGRHVVRRFAAFEPGRLTVVATRARGGDDLVDRVHGIDEVHALLPEHDVVVLVVPHTDATHHLVDAGFLAAMRDGALLVNVARGKVVDTDALLAACAAGHVRAALDVTDPEPVPPGHPLWTTPGVLVSPHGGGATDVFFDRATDLLRRQLTLLGRGEPVGNVVVPATRRPHRDRSHTPTTRRTA